MLPRTRQHPSLFWGLIFSASMLGIAVAQEWLLFGVGVLQDKGIGVAPAMRTVVSALALLLYVPPQIASYLATRQTGRARSGLLAGFTSGLVAGVLVGGLFGAESVLAPSVWLFLMYAPGTQTGALTPAPVLVSGTLAVFVFIGITASVGGIVWAERAAQKRQRTIHQRREQY